MPTIHVNFAVDQICSLPELITFWDFQEPAGTPRVAQGSHFYELREAAEPIERVAGGVFGPYSASFSEGQWFSLPRAECPALDIHGPDAAVSVVAWIKRRSKNQSYFCEAIAGMWNELDCKRQYALFLSALNCTDRVCGHISAEGGPTPGAKFCQSAAVGASRVPFNEWQMVGFTYDGRHARAFLNGALDTCAEMNPLPYDGGIFDGGWNGSDFTVGAVGRSGVPGEVGNYFVGQIGGLAVFRCALSSEEMRQLYLSSRNE